MGTPPTDHTGCSLHGVERTVKARITRADGSTVVGHMQVSARLPLFLHVQLCML